MQKQQNKRSLLAGAVLGVLTISATTIGLPSQSRAASQAECAIWICLPGGFPTGCGAAHAAFIKRIRALKPPLPDFNACAVDSGNISYNWGGFTRDIRCGKDDICGEQSFIWVDVPSLGKENRYHEFIWRERTYGTGSGDRR